MKQDNYGFNSSEIPVLANQILSSYKRDKSHFEQYSPKFNNEFLIHFEEEVNFLIHQLSSPTFKGLITKSNEKIEALLTNFSSMVFGMEIFLRRNYPVKGMQVANFSLKEVTESLSKGCIWEIQRSCMKLIHQLEINLEEFIDKGFMTILIADLHLLTGKLNDIELELAESTHSQGMISDEFRYKNNQLIDLLDTIVESTPAVFGETDAAKREEYSPEKLILLAQFMRSEIQ